jgi:hypothetical protein
MKSNPKFWQIGAVLVVLVFGYVGWMLLVRPVFAAVGQTRDETTATEEQTQRTMFETRQLAEQKKDLQEQIDSLERIRAKIPKDVNVPKLMRTIQAEARAEGVELDSLQPGQITLFKVPEPSPSPSSAKPEPNASQSPAPKPVPTPTNLGQGVAPRNTGVAYVPLTLSGQGAYSAIRRLTSRLEQQQRAFLVTLIDVNRQGDDKAQEPLQFTMQARVFVLNGDNVSLPADLRTDGGD